MQFCSKTLALTLAVAFIGSAGASEIYKWVDEDGNVHFEDRPSDEISVEVVDIQSRPTDPELVHQQVQARLDQKASAAEAAANAPQGPSKDELAAEAADRKQKCDMYTQRLQTFIVKRHLYRQQEDGERYYLNEDEMKEARDGVREQIAEYCDN